MKKSTFKRDILVLSITLFIVIASWIGFHIYNVAVTSTLDETLTFQIVPIPGEFDMETVNDVLSRKKVEPLFSEAVIQEQASESGETSQQQIEEQEAIPTVEPPQPSVTQEEEAP